MLQLDSVGWQSRILINEAKLRLLGKKIHIHLTINTKIVKQKFNLFYTGKSGLELLGNETLSQIISLTILVL